MLSLLLVVVAVALLAAWSGVASRFPRQFRRVPANSEPGADGIWSDLSGASVGGSGFVQSLSWVVAAVSSVA